MCVWSGVVAVLSAVIPSMCGMLNVAHLSWFPPVARRRLTYLSAESVREIRVFFSMGS